MPLSLSQAALDVTRGGPRRAALLSTPLLVWMSPVEGDPDDAWVQTATGGGAQNARPRAGEALVYPMVKQPSGKNAFALGITLGRVESNDLFLNDPTVSRFHAWFALDAKSGAWSVTDAESDNGTWVGAARLKPGSHQRLGEEVALRFGAVEVRFYEPPAFTRFISAL